MPSTGTVLIITDAADTTASRVAAELALRSVPVITFDTADFPTRLNLEADFDGARWLGALKGRTGEGRPVDIDLGQVSAIYYRKPTQFQLVDGMSRPEQMWAYKEARRGFGGVLRSLNCLWVNDPVNVAAAEYKPAQLAAAAQSGLKVPRTTITNDPDHARRWAKSIGSGFVYKPLGGAFHTEGDTAKIVYTTPLDDPDELNDPAISLTAHMFQEWIEKAYECRAIVVGHQVFAVAIHAGSDRAKVDWRSDYDALTYAPIELPKAVADGLVRVHQRLGLLFGAADLAVTPAGEWVFFETNPSGQYGWLVHEVGLPVAPAIANLLKAGSDAIGC